MAKKSNEQALEVWLDADLVSERIRVGTLFHQQGHIRFAYEPSWIKNPARFMLDPELSLDSGMFFPDPKRANFGIFMDSCPDRWGQHLMDRREAMLAKDEDRPRRTLYAWDYLLGVQDATRMGALRFCHAGTNLFLDQQLLPAPPITSLPELESVAIALTHQRIDHLDQLRRWLAVLVTPGASLGGAHPKANFTEIDGSLWIAKFPSHQNDYDLGAWEKLVHDLARDAGIWVPPSKLMRFSGNHHTFCVKRFDRVQGRRRFFTSAMTLLEKVEGENSGYLDLAEFICNQGAARQIQTDLAQLFRRVAFNIMVGNRDDHLRNHGFIRESEGWVLSMAYDMNPSMNKAEHVLAIDEADPRPNIATLIQTADFYRLNKIEATKIINEVAQVIRTWRERARHLRIVRSEIELMSGSFSHAEIP